MDVNTTSGSFYGKSLHIVGTGGFKLSETLYSPELKTRTTHMISLTLESFWKAMRIKRSLHGFAFVGRAQSRTIPPARPIATTF
jgi:hypothetical protein